MTREQLKAYISKKEEITELEEKLKNLSEDDSFVCSSVINNYNSGFPIPQAVVGMDWKRYDRYRKQYTLRIEELKKECELVEAYIEAIDDSMIRRVFRMYFLEGMSQKQIGKYVHLDKSNVSRKIEIFLKSQRTQQMQRYNNN